MRTTVRLDGALLERAKREAARRKTTLTVLLEEGLQLALARRKHPARQVRVSLPVCTAGSGTLPGIDLDDTSALLDAMEARR
jgi:ribonuclease PH